MLIVEYCFYLVLFRGNIHLRRSTAFNTVIMLCLRVWLMLALGIASGLIGVDADVQPLPMCTFLTDKNGLHANCSSLALTEVPLYIQPNVTSIDLSMNDIAIIPNNSFNTFKLLRTLRINFNRLSILEAHAFKGCDSLEHLDLSHNYLKLSYESYPETVFDELKNLKWLDLRSNVKGSIDSYPDRILLKLNHLDTLKIDTFRRTVFGPAFSQLVSLRKLELGGDDCDARKLLNNTFLSFANSSLEVLNLTLCSLQILESGTFTPLSKLQELIMPYSSPVGVKNVLKSLFPFSGRKMRLLNFRKIHVKSSFSGKIRLTDAVLSAKDTQYLAEICVERVVLSQNNLIYIDIFGFISKRFSRCIKDFDASFNSFIMNLQETYLLINLFENVQNLDISMQQKGLTTPHFEQVSKKFLQNASSETRFQTKFKSSDSFLKGFSERSQSKGLQFNVPKNLKNFNISAVSHSFGSILQNVTITNGHSLTSINISFLGFDNFNMRVTGLEQLIQLDISGNNNLQLQDSFFHSFPSLETLYMNYLTFRQENVHQGIPFFQSLKKLKCLYLSHNKLSSLPGHLLQNNHELIFLDLSYNLFSSIPIGVLSIPNLLSLDMSSNALGYVNDMTRIDIDYHTKELNGSFHLQLDGNLLSCGCGSFDFLVWLHETKVMMDNNRNFSCLLANGDVSNTKTKTENLTRLWRKCTGQSLFYVSFSLFSLLVCGIMTTLLVKTNKTALIECFMDILRKQIETKHRSQFEKDLYIYYPDIDYQWVFHNLRPKLEERNLRLFIADIDLELGGNTAEDITKNIDKSWKILLYFTMNFQTDQWGIYTMSTALSAMNTRSRDSIILLLPQDQYPRIPECLLKVVPESCILRVPRRLTGADPFWDDLYTLVVQTDNLEF